MLSLTTWAFFQNNSIKPLFLESHQELEKAKCFGTVKVICKQAERAHMKFASESSTAKLCFISGHRDFSPSEAIRAATCGSGLLT
jgi:hypothetical protein